MSLAPAKKPVSLLGYYRLLSPTAGVRVSPLCLGAMNFGDVWKQSLGECDKKTSFEIMDTFYNAGGNFIDTANNYQSGESEKWVGEWMKARGNRDEIVLATKFSSVYVDAEKTQIRANYNGNHNKSLRLSVEASLEKLQTTYIDLLWLHWWDFSTSIPELMQSLHHLVVSGKVLYLGVSDTPAWVVAKANQYARDHALTQFCTYQGRWSAATRDFERDILPMARDEGMSLCPWGALGGGAFKKADELAKGEGRKRYSSQSEDERKVTEVLDRIATKRNTRITSIALAYVRSKYAYVYPIVGGRTKEHIESNIAALNIVLTPEEVEEVEAATSFDIGFPLNILAGIGFVPNAKYTTEFNTGDIFLVKTAAHVDTVEHQRPVKPRVE